MRTILFRATATTGETVFGFYSHVIIPVHNYNEHKIYDSDTRITHDVVGETVGQFTGLTTKSKVKIFEGDIVKAIHPQSGFSKHFRILYNDDVCAFVVWCGSNPSLSFPLTCDTVLDYQLEVVGDIHKNAYLLKK